MSQVVKATRSAAFTRWLILPVLLAKLAPAAEPRIYLIERYSTNQVLIHFDTDPDRTCTLQYYWRTEGESGFTFGNELMLSGGPGAYVLTGKNYTLNLQALAAYETRARDEFLGSKSNNTGMTAWYLGPQLALTLGEHFSANAGVDLPLRIGNNGLQNLPDFRIHAGVNWRF